MLPLVMFTGEIADSKVVLHKEEEEEDDAKLNIVCRLGGFHSMMSFLGSLGELMKESATEDLFIEVHAEHTVTHIMMSGKTDLRSHFSAVAAST